MEVELLNALKFDITIATAKHFAQHFLRAAMIAVRISSSNSNDNDKNNNNDDDTNNNNNNNNEKDNDANWNSCNEAVNSNDKKLLKHLANVSNLQ